MSPLPLLFNFQNLVKGDGFMAYVSTFGRVLLSEEDGEVWMFGIQPGCLAASGADQKSALEAFRTEYHKVLEDAASGARTFADYKLEVESLFLQVHTVALADWERARELVRTAQPANPEFPLVRENDLPFAVEVHEIMAEAVNLQQIQRAAKGRENQHVPSNAYGKAA